MRIFRWFGPVTAALVIAACARDPKPGSPEAAAAGERSMRSMSDTLAAAKTFAFETLERIEVPGPDGQKRTLNFTRRVTVQRPNSLSFELHGAGDAPLDVAAYYDGRTATLADRTGRVWARADVPSTLDEMLDHVARRFGLPVPIADVVYSSPYDAFIGKGTTGGFVGRETIGGTECVKLVYDDPFVQVRLWLPESGQPLPRQLDIVHKKAPGQPVSHMDFTSWTLDVPVADGAFAFQPPSGYAEVAFGDLVAGLTGGKPSNPTSAGVSEVETTRPGAPGAK